MTLLSQSSVLVIGVNHHTAPIAFREKLHFEKDHARHVMRDLCDRSILQESLLLSTCNRVEIYGVTQNLAEATERLQYFLAEKQQLPMSELQPYLYHYFGLSAITHGFRVVSSLDSLVIGEPQITGQVKDAYRMAEEVNTVGSILSQFFNRAFYVAKKVRNETKISSGAVSVGYAACELGKQIFSSLKGKTILVMGAGEIGERIVEHLMGQELGELMIANRTLERVGALQNRFGGTVIPLDRCREILPTVDIVMSSLAVDTPIWPKHDIEPLLKHRTAPLYMIDVSVPRSLHPSLHELSTVYLYNIDDLESAVARNSRERLLEASKAEHVVCKEAELLYQEAMESQIAPTISLLSQKLHDIKEKELEKTLKKLTLSSDEHRAVSACADAIVNKILHAPILELKAQKHDASKLKQLIATVSSLFNLD